MKKIGIGLLVVVLLVLGGLYLYLDRLVESAIERSSQQATGVNTDVEAATFDLWTGELEMDAFTVQNPSGTFEGPFFLSLGEGQVQTPFAALWRDTVAVPRVTLADLTVNLEQRGLRSNYQIILNNLNEFVAAEEPEAGPTLVVDDLVIRNTTVDLYVAPEVADLPPVADLTATIPVLRVQNVGGAEGMSPADLTAFVITTVLRAVLESEVSLPSVVHDVLQTQLEGLPDVPVQVEGPVEVTGAEDVRQRAEEAKEQAEGLLDRARDLFEEDTSDGDTQRP